MARNEQYAEAHVTNESMHLGFEHYEQSRIAQRRNKKSPGHDPTVAPNRPFTDAVPGRLQVGPKEDQRDRVEPDKQ